MKILFVCHGNICRSPMAEFVLKKMLADRGVEGVEVASAATSREELGNDVYPPAKAALRAHGIPFGRRAARQVTRADYEAFDRIYVMDGANVRNIRYVIGDDAEGKVERLLPGRDVADPWYTDDFETAFADIADGCARIADELASRRG